MDTATEVMTFAEAPRASRESLTSAPFPAEAAPKITADAQHHIDQLLKDASIVGALPKKDAVADAQGHGLSLTLTAPALNNDEAIAKTDIDGGSETAVPSLRPINGMTADAVKEDHSNNFIQAPMPLTNGHQEDLVASPNMNQTFVDIWSPATKLKRRLEDTKDLIVCPGVYDGFSARIALSVGFDAMYMTGAGTTASRLGMADLGVASRTDMKEHADMIANLDPGKITIADMDTGYGGPITVTATVNQYIRANVAGFHIEDQLLTKRCGHLSGKKVVSREDYLSRIRAAKAAKDKARSDIVLIARTDANQQLGYDECIVRLRAARDLGADVGLLEGFKSKDEARRAVRDLAPWPLLLNVVENGHSPLFTVDEARDMGFRIIIFSFGALVPAYLAIKAAFERLKTQGVTGVHETGISPRSISDVCGLGEAIEVDEIAGGESFKGGV